MTGLSTYTNEEIKAEYVERFGEPELSDWSSSDLIEELNERGTMPEPDMTDIVQNLPEFLDLIAEAARTSRHAVKAYALLRDAIPDLEPLPMRQALIAGRMGEVA